MVCKKQISGEKLDFLIQYAMQEGTFLALYAFQHIPGPKVENFFHAQLNINEQDNSCTVELSMKRFIVGI